MPGMNSWVLPLKPETLGKAGLLHFREELEVWWNGEPEEASRSRYQNGDTVYLANEDGKLWGWGHVASLSHEGRIEADDDEEGQTPPFWVKYSDTLVVQPQVTLDEAVPASIHVSKYDSSPLSTSQVHTLRRALLDRAIPRIITLDHVNPDLLARLRREPEILRTLHWRDFERLLARILEEFGYTVDLMRGTKDGGVDLFALSSLHHPLGPHKYLLQAKRWRRSVGVAPVRELQFLHEHHRITKSCLATTSTFTNGAWQLARQYSYQLELRDFEGISDWIKRFSVCGYE